MIVGKVLNNLDNVEEEIHKVIEKTHILRLCIGTFRGQG